MSVLEVFEAIGVIWVVAFICSAAWVGKRMRQEREPWR